MDGGRGLVVIPSAPSARAELVSYLQSPNLIRVMVSSPSSTTHPPLDPANPVSANTRSAVKSQGAMTSVEICKPHRIKRKRGNEDLDQKKAESAKSILQASQASVEPVSMKATPSFFIHQDLLASRSPELHKHVYNSMKEGLEHVLVLHDVESSVVERFVSWVYTKSYCDEIHQGTGMVHEYILLNTRIYVFGDRFNIDNLREQAMNNISRKMKNGVHDASTVSELIDAILYAFENLPTSGLLTEPKSTVASNGTKLEGENTGGDKLLRFWVKFVAWKLGTFRQLDNFHKLLRNPDIASALIHQELEPGTQIPWAPKPKPKYGKSR